MPFIFPGMKEIDWFSNLGMNTNIEMYEQYVWRKHYG
jgi:hypothetical protein